ncbi:hypothetical protein BOX15_Mlig000540g1 [Macrostomum lignano]|uniref:STAS domain-containing protein n=1 Tax=Macrostomum lignano TaxID=282301 RepID=A0A267E172_9PLAT|nr:hypothetical protein BOX15_Mlig000540g1 [Macrostomum lignano]
MASTVELSNSPETEGQQDHDSSIDYLVHRKVYNYAKFTADEGEAIKKNRSLRREITSGLKDTCVPEKPTLQRLIPFIGLLQSGQYKTDDFVSDLIAGATMCVFHIPQGLAYSLLAGLKPITGLYTSLIPVLIFAVFGRSRHLSIGTYAVLSLILLDMIEEHRGAYLQRMQDNNITGASFGFNYTDTDYARLQIAMVGSFSASLIMMFIGLFRLGFFMTYISDSMLKGFTTAAGVHVMMSQVPLVFGVEVPRTTSRFKIIGTLINLFKVIHKTNFVTLGLSAASCIILYLVREFVNPRVKKKIRVPLPIELLIIIGTLLVSYFAKLNSDFNVSIVGEVPRGLPALLVPDMGFLPTVFASSIPVGIVGGIVSMSLAKLYCLQFQYSYDYNEDFAILGASSLVSSFFQCFFPCTALARNAVVVSVGMKSQMASIVSCGLMLLVLLLVGPLFHSVPTCALGSIIIVSLIGVIKQVTELPQIWRISRIDFSVWLVAALSVLILDVTLGLAIGLGFTLFSVILRTQSARIAVLGRIGVTDIYRDVREYPAAEELPGLKIVRFDAPLNFANAERLRDFVMQLVDDCARPADSDDQAGKSSRVHTILLDCSSWVYADMVGIRTVKEAYALLLSRNYRVLFAACKDSVRLLFFQEDFLKDADVSLFYLTVHDAVLFASRVAPNNQAETVSEVQEVKDTMAIEMTNRPDSANNDAGVALI